MRLLRASIRYPRAVIGAVAFLTIAGSLYIPRIEVRLDGRSLVPIDHPSMRASDEAAAVFDLHDLVVLALHRADQTIYTVDGLRQLASLGRELTRCDGIVGRSIASLATAPRLVIHDDTLDLQPLLTRASPIDAALVDRVRSETAFQGLDDGVLVSRDGRTAAIYAGIEPDTDRVALRRCVSALTARAATGGVEVSVSGTAMAQAALGEAAVVDLSRLLPMVLVIVGGVLVAAFRHVTPAIVSLAEVATTLVWTAALMGLTHQQVFVTTLSLPVIVLVIGVSDDLYALNHFFLVRQRDPSLGIEAATEAAFASIRRPIMVTAFTTALGLLSLATTSLQPLRTFGVFGACAVLISTAFTLTLVPALLVLTGARGVPVAPPGAARAERIVGRMVRGVSRIGRPRVIAVAAAVAVVAAVVGSRVTIDDSWIGNLPPSSEVVRGDRAINAALAGTNTIEVMFDAGTDGGYRDPQRLAALGRIEQALLKQPFVGAVQGLSGDVVRVVAAMNDAGYADYRAQLARGERQLTPVDVEQAVMLLDALRGSPLPARLDRSHRRARMTIFMREANYSRTAQVLHTIRTAAEEAGGAAGAVVPFGDGWIGYNTIQLIVTGQITSIAMAIGTDTILVALLLASLPAALVAMAPVVFAIALLFAALSVTGTPIGTASSMFAAIALGIGADYSIHLVTACRSRIAAGMSRVDAVGAALAGTGPAILMSAVALPAGFLVLAASEVRPNRELGILIASSMVVCALLTLTLVPVLLSGKEARRDA